MDPRAQRSLDRLRVAVLHLAAETPITKITAVAVCRAAGVTRETFYQHTGSPTELLVAALAADVNADVGDAFPEIDARRSGGHDASTPFDAGERALLAHVSRQGEVYRRNAAPKLAAPLREHLEGMILRQLRAHLGSYPEIVPTQMSDATPNELDMIAAYAASGTVGAIEVWLHAPEIDLERAVRVIFAASPAWWLRFPDAPATSTW
ncbi:TetR/AcrR family transcriptional regulator [Leucobacter sp. M11]|uniref:TetR/AcrR family transcriptional regulator n=1 Tax=Leucobacter sp. M11 TaxID=2993565 RepID=UPI002D80A7C3|nr:hypothetical protein [Leucobacter sp. M11]MEB4614073.1 hypothetical protein [Leucobacter sp. M11]